MSLIRGTFTLGHCIRLQPVNKIINQHRYINQILNKRNNIFAYKPLNHLSFAISTIVLGVENSDLKNKSPPIITTTQLPDITTQKPDMDNYRLPDSVKPETYDLILKPHLKTGLYDGEVTIKVTIESNVNEIKLHTNGMQIISTKIDGTSYENKILEEYELLVISVPGGLKKGEAVVNIVFSGDMRNRIVGLYTSSYKNGEDLVSIATSKFEPTYARQAFPCFDEPNMKAHFTVHLLKPKDTEYIALSNMPRAFSNMTDEGELVTFEESVKMSTYLACFIVSDFKHTTDTIVFGNQQIPFKVYATPAQLQKTEYARIAGKKIMEFYLGYFKIPYPLPKLDMVAIPDFVSGAMEHWGLVTYRETALLYDPSISSSANKQRVATVVAHELAHSWFGNLVTMNWWNDLWLNEGFASYIEYKGVHAAEPTWQMLHQFIVEDLHAVLKLDATLGSHPIVQTVETPNQITEIFDTISYNKGASILRMLENAVGESVFQEGVTNYLNEFAFGNAVTQNLLDELQKLIGDAYDLTDFMNTWTVQMGYPIVNVTRVGNVYTLTQNRFLTDSTKRGKNIKESAYNYKWTIPVTYVTSKDTTTSKMIWFDHTKDSVEIEEDAAWVKFNHEQVGYYRVNYDVPAWNALIDKFGTFSIPNRAHFIEETFRIAEANQLGYELPLDLTKKLSQETEYIPWSVASAMLYQIKKYLTTSEYYNDFKEYVVKIVTPSYIRLTWTEAEGEEHLISRARVTILSLACDMGHAECLAEANSRFTNWLAGSATLSQDLRSLVYTYGMQTGSKDDWEKLWALFVKEGDAGEKLRLLNGLASINDPTLLTRLIQLSKDDTFIRDQDYYTCLQYISSNPIGTSIVWDYVRENWEYLVDRFTINDRYLGRLIPSITSSFATQTKLDEMNAFFAKYPEAGAGVSARAQALETVENNIKWLKNNKGDVENWIKNQIQTN